MKKLFSTIMPVLGICAITLGSCSECCTYLNSDGTKGKVCKNDATEYDWAEFRDNCEEYSTNCDCN